MYARGYVKRPYFVLVREPEEELTMFNLWKYGYYAGECWVDPETGEMVGNEVVSWES